MSIDFITTSIIPIALSAFPADSLRSRHEYMGVKPWRNSNRQCRFESELTDEPNQQSMER
jgi:hypothetical protein